MSTNLQVIQKFLNKEGANSLNMTSTGRKLFSYNTIIAEWAGPGFSVLVVNKTKYSRTTSSKHQGPLYREIEKSNVAVVVECGGNKVNTYVPFGTQTLKDA